jgi:mannose-1-phosphate guanylyltransferase
MRDPEAGFLQMIREAEKLAVEQRVMVTGGIKATEATLGVDYLKLDGQIGDSREAYKIAEFLFRPKTLRETRALVENFHVVVHSNHTCWYPDLMLEAYKQYRPDWYKALMKIKDVMDKPGENEAIEEIYATMEKGPTEDVTTHVMNSGQAMVILLPYKWTDVGTWNSVYDFFEDGRANYKDGDVITVDTHGSLIKTDNKQKLVAVAGVQDLVIVDTEDVLLVIPKEQIDKIKQIQEKLKEREENEYL